MSPDQQADLGGGIRPRGTTGFRTPTGVPDTFDPDADPFIPCDKCGPDKWVEVFRDAEGTYLGNDRWNPVYAHIEVLVPVLDEAGEEVDAELQVIDKVASSEVYPCPVCLPAQFLRWASGCYASGHTGCKVCQPSNEPSEGRRRT